MQSWMEGAIHKNMKLSARIQLAGARVKSVEQVDGKSIDQHITPPW